jgi:serine/threonine protein kinase
MNEECLDSLGNCLKKVGIVLYNEELGAGAYGDVQIHDVIYNNKHMKLAIKIVHKSKDYDMDSAHEEAKYAHAMSMKEIGPMVYYTFHDKYSQYFIMEPMDMNCETFLQSVASVDNKKTVVENMVALILKKVFKLKIMCTDIKPSNFIMNKPVDRSINVKMIDFGLFCNKNDDVLGYVRKKKNVYCFMVFLQLKLFFYFITGAFFLPWYESLEIDLNYNLRYITCKEMFIKLYNDKIFLLQEYCKDLTLLYEIYPPLLGLPSDPDYK